MRIIAFPVAPPAEHSLDFDVRVRLPEGARFARFERNPVVLWGHVADDAIRKDGTGSGGADMAVLAREIALLRAEVAALRQEGRPAE